MQTSLSKSLSAVPKSVKLTPDLVIKQLDESHTKELFSLTDRNRSYLKKWLPWLDSCTRESDTLYFIISTKDALSKHTGVTFGIFYKCSIAGSISFNQINWLDGRADIGYWIGEAFQGSGLVTLACSKLIDIGFKLLNLKKMSISCALENTKSRNIPMRLGFKETKIVPKKENLYGRYVDHIIYTIHKDAYPSG
ncbi:MAG: GNAT family N-acetyltransferase [Candidatus Cardinium sp.]|nr:GNAT family N-acetyltransferase [Candidatus Cardinium sp.]